jgi:hypothetical protein
MSCPNSSLRGTKQSHYESKQVEQLVGWRPLLAMTPDFIAISIDNKYMS